MAPFLSKLPPAVQEWLASMRQSIGHAIGHGRQDVTVFLATGFGVGYSPWGPGTWGTVVAIPLAWFSSLFGLFHIFITILLTVAGIKISQQASVQFGSKDPQQIVIDEIAGFFVAVAFIPMTWPWWLAAFILFRFFDITKPSLIDKVQHLPGGYGIMMDDVLAGIVTACILNVLAYGLA